MNAPHWKVEDIVRTLPKTAQRRFFGLAGDLLISFLPQISVIFRGKYGRLGGAGHIRLVPAVPRQAYLAQDYATMRPMFMTEPPPFAELMGRLAEAETGLNAL